MPLQSRRYLDKIPLDYNNIKYKLYLYFTTSMTNVKPLSCLNFINTKLSYHSSHSLNNSIGNKNLDITKFPMNNEEIQNMKINK